MNRVPVWLGAVTKGRLTLDAEAEFRRYIKALPDQPIQLVLSRKKSQRSLEQNSWIWGIAYPIIAGGVGYDDHETHDPQTLDAIHYALIAKWGGEHYEKRLGIMVPNKRSSTLTTKEFSDYMEWLVRYAAQELGGILVPLPGESVE